LTNPKFQTRAQSYTLTALDAPNTRVGCIYVYYRCDLCFSNRCRWTVPSEDTMSKGQCWVNRPTDFFVIENEDLRAHGVLVLCDIAYNLRHS